MKDYGSAALHEWDCGCASCTADRRGKPPGEHTPEQCMSGREPKGCRCCCRCCTSIRLLFPQFLAGVDWDVEDALVAEAAAE